MSAPAVATGVAQAHALKHPLIAHLAQHHVGAARGVRARDLARALDCPERELRHAISQLREEGIAVCGTPASGYFIARDAEEVEACCAFLRSRALHSLHLEARLRRIPLPVLLGQLHLTETADRAAAPRAVATASTTETHPS